MVEAEILADPDLLSPLFKESSSILLVPIKVEFCRLPGFPCPPIIPLT